MSTIGNGSAGGAFAVGDRQLRDDGCEHPDWSAGYGQVDGYIVVGASALGRLHVRDASPRDDAFAARTAGRWLAVAVSDGVGSRPLSRYGSSFCVEALCDHLLAGLRDDAANFDDVRGSSVPTSPEEPLTSPLTEDAVVDRLGEIANHAATLTWSRRAPRPGSADPAARHGIRSADTEVQVDLVAHMTNAFSLTRDGLDKFAEQRKLNRRDLSCTLLGFVLDTTSGRVACGQVGDGLISVTDSTSPRPLVDAIVSENGDVYTMSHNDWRNRLAVSSCTLPDGSPWSGMLMTDGVSEDHVSGPPEGLFDQWSRDMDTELREQSPSFAALRLLHWLSTYHVKGSFDDRTLVAVLTDGAAESWGNRNGIAERPGEVRR